MKNIRFITFVLLLGTLLLSACGAGAATRISVPEAVTSAKVEAMPVAFVGMVNSMAGDQWVISGTTVTVDPSIVRDGPFKVGDQVKVEGHVSPDGSFTVSRVEAPTPQETATLLPFVDDNSNDANTNDDHGADTNVNDDHGNDANINDDQGGAGNTNDDNSNVTGPSNNNSNDDRGGNSSGGGNDNSGSGKGSGGGNDNGGNSNDD